MVNLLQGALHGAPNVSLFPIESIQKITINPELIKVCLDEIKTKNKVQYHKNLTQFQTNSPEEKQIIAFYINGKLDLSIKNHPLVLLKQIENFVEKSDFTQAGLLLILKRSIFFGVSDQFFLKELVLQQMLIMRSLFCSGILHVLSELYLINFTEPINDDGFKAKFLLLSGCSAVGCRDYINAIDIFKQVQKLNCKFKQRAKSAYLLGAIYDYLFLLEGDKDYLSTSKHWFKQAHNQVNCLWSLLGHLAINQKPKIISIRDAFGIPAVLSGLNQNDLIAAKKCWQQGKYKLGIQHIHSLKKEDFEVFSPLMIETIKYFIEHRHKAAMYKIGILCFKYTGKIIRECFNFPIYLQMALQQNMISKDEAIELMAVANEESKLLDYTYYNLNTPTGLGIFQLHPNEIKKFVKKVKIVYNKEEFLANPLLQTRFAIEIWRYHKQFVRNNMIFALFYFVSGHKAYQLKEKTAFLRQSHPLHSVVILSHVVSGRTRRYLISVLEFIVLQNIIMYGCFPKLSYLL